MSGNNLCWYRKPFKTYPLIIVPFQCPTVQRFANCVAAGQNVCTCRRLRLWCVPLHRHRNLAYNWPDHWRPAFPFGTSNGFVTGNTINLVESTVQTTAVAQYPSKPYCQSPSFWSLLIFFGQGQLEASSARRLLGRLVDGQHCFKILRSLHESSDLHSVGSPISY